MSNDDYTNPIQDDFDIKAVDGKNPEDLEGLKRLAKECLLRRELASPHSAFTVSEVYRYIEKLQTRRWV